MPEVMTIIPCEGTTIGYSTTKTGTYTTLGDEVTSITLPSIKVTAVPTHGITSTYKSRRAGKIMDSDNAGIKFYLDPNFADHAGLMANALAAATLWWEVTFMDEHTTHAKLVFPAFMEDYKIPEIGEDKNVENDLNLNVAGLFEFTAGSTTP